MSFPITRIYIDATIKPTIVTMIVAQLGRVVQPGALWLSRDLSIL